MATDCKQCVSYEACKPYMTNASHKTPDCENFVPQSTTVRVNRCNDCLECEECSPIGSCSCDDSPPDVQVADESMDLLCDMFARQMALNKKYGFVPGGGELSQELRDLHDGLWLNNFVMAMIDEAGELRDCTKWKHWYKEAREGKRFLLTDREHAKVEVVDLMFFLMSMAQAVGMTAPEFYGLYIKKLTLNHQRRDDDCTQQEAKSYKLEE